MKKLIITLLIIVFISCKKENNRPLASIASYVGTYYGTRSDTAIVSSQEDTTFAIIKWKAAGMGAKIDFDSVKVHTNQTITCSEQIEYCSQGRAVGSGVMGNNKLQFTFTLIGGCDGDVIFNGIK